MSHVLIELLENSGFMHGETIESDRVAHAKRSELVDRAVQSAELTSASRVTSVDSIFSHTASLSLGGDPLPCMGMNCRLRRANELAQFAAFYSDRVFINNGLFAFGGRQDRMPLDFARSHFLDELRVFSVFRPLIEAGLIIPITPNPELCFHCLGKGTLPDHDQNRFDRAIQRVEKRFSKETIVTLETSDDGSLKLHVRGDDELVEHGGTFMKLGKATKLLPPKSPMAKKLASSGIVNLPVSLRKELGVDQRRAHELFRDIGFEMGISQCLNTSVVTDQTLHVDILNSFSKSTNLDQRNSLIERHLTCLVPFLNSVSPVELLKLRTGEGDAFISFRQAFAKAIDERTRLKSGRLTKRDAESIYKEILEPELARLNQKFNSARKSIFKKSRAGVLGWTAAISAGFYFGFVESSLIAAAQALGLTKVAADLATGLISSSGEEAIRNENLYFLWKVRQHAERA
jgi:hypothetical protein